jgi:cell division protein FtsI (penicillin-binding protein 3)
MMAEAVANGTGTSAQIDGYEVAGKTGTARKPQPGGGYTDEAGRYHYVSTFAGFIPAVDPKLSIIVVIDEPGTSPYAAEVAAPAFAEIGRHALRIMGVPPIAPQPRAPLAPEPDRVRATPAVAPTTLPPTTDTTAPAVPTDPAVAAAAEAAATASTAPPPDPVAGAPPLLLD